MGVKKVITLVEILALTGLVSVGFSSWVITVPTTITTTGTIGAENVINNNNYIIVKNINFSDYDISGFYPDFIYTNGAKNYAILEADISIDLKKYRTDLNVRPSTLNLEISLGYQKEPDDSFYDIISDTSEFESTLTYNCDGGSTYEENNFSLVDYQIIYTFSISNVTNVSTINMHVSYTFNEVAFDNNDYLNLYMNKGIPFRFSTIINHS